MAFEFVSLPAAEQPDLIQFLVKSYHADSSVPSFRPDVMHWKYFADHPQWSGPRALAIKQDGQIVAYGGVWPIPLATTNLEIRGIHLNDWAASRSAVGAGVFLLRKAAALADVHFAVGGSDDTRTILPKLGYKIYGELRQYTRVVRPWLQFRTTPQKTWKTPLKFMQHSTRALKGIPPVPAGWRATKVSSFTPATEVVTNQPTSFISPRRTAAALNHLLTCPAARFSGFQVSDEKGLRGYFLLTQIGRQSRIVDIRINTEDPESWQAVCSLAARTAAADPETCEIVAASSVDLTTEAWLKAGFLRRRVDPIYCYDPRKLMSSGPPLDLHLADNDFCILSDAANPYLS